MTIPFHNANLATPNFYITSCFRPKVRYMGILTSNLRPVLWHELRADYRGAASSC